MTKDRDTVIETAWRKHWAMVATCNDDAPNSPHDIERTGFRAGYLAALAEHESPEMVAMREAAKNLSEGNPGAASTWIDVGLVWVRALGKKENADG